jgi:dynein heavy chain
VIGVQPREAGGSAAARDDDIVVQMSEDLQTKIAREITFKGANPALFEEQIPGQPNSLTVVLQQEVDRYNKLLTVLHTSLKTVAGAIRGEVLMTADVLEVHRSLLNRQVPAIWKAVAYPSLKPLASWCRDLQARVAFILEWIKKGEPTVYWFPGLFFPQSFLTATLQNHSRKHLIPIDRLSFACAVIDKDWETVVAQPEDGVYIRGLSFDGAQWNSAEKHLDDAGASGGYVPCPIIHLIPKPEFTHPPEDYRCPIYRTAERAGVLSTTGHSTNFVVAVNLLTSKPPQFWTLRGAALLLETPY